MAIWLPMATLRVSVCHRGLKLFPAASTQHCPVPEYNKQLDMQQHDIKTMHTHPEAHHIATARHTYTAFLTAVLPTVLVCWDVTQWHWVPIALRYSGQCNTLCIVSFLFIPSLSHYILVFEVSWSHTTCHSW